MIMVLWSKLTLKTPKQRQWCCFGVVSETSGYISRVSSFDISNVPQTSLRGVIRLYEIKSVKGLIWEPEVLKSKHYGDLVEIKDT